MESPHGHGEIEKPQTDHREYRAFVLDNGLRAIVISDSKCDKAAAALSVKVGSIFDPKEVQGLAHFCEHMLFLGTEKYPKEDEYNEFLAQHGGMSNAYTADSLTNYFFGVSPSHLEGALDRFSQFFLHPLFTESATDRELQAIESEHSKNQQSDAWRWKQLLRSDANPEHPLCHFGTGSCETLKVIPEKNGCPVRQRLLDFHKKYYSANIMAVTVLGKESPEELQTLVRKCFESVVNSNVVIPVGSEVGDGKPVFLTETWPRLVRVVPVRDVRSISFQFVMPQQMPARWRTKPTRYLSFLIGHEGCGSLLSALKAQGLATELMAGPSMDDAGVCIFEIGIQLTELGETKVQVVGELLFSYIRLVQQEPVSDDLFHENQCIEEMNFRFRSVGNPISTAQSLSHGMQSGLPVEKVLSGPAKVWDLDKDQIAEAAGWLGCSSLRLVVASKSSSFTSLCTETETWYGTRYCAGPLPAEWHEAWERCQKGEGAGCSASATADAEKLGLMLPKPNPFIAKDLALKTRPADGVPKHPLLLKPLAQDIDTMLTVNLSGASGTHILQTYFRQDDTFDLPKAHMNLELYCPWSGECLENRIATSAWCQCVMEELNELSYDADVAGLSYFLAGSSRGISISVGGYQDKLRVLLKIITDKMGAFGDVPESTFNLVHSMMLRNAKINAKNKQPHQQAIEWEQRCLHRTSVTGAELLEQVETLSRETLTGVNRKLLSQCYGELLIQGNITRDEVPHVLHPLSSILQPTAALAQVAPAAVGQLPGEPRTCVVMRRSGTNQEERNGAAVVTLQAVEEGLQMTTLAELAAQVLGQRCFDELRTKQQLGYIVALQPYADNIKFGFCGLRVIVQSEKHPAEVHRRIDTWLESALESLADETQMPDEKLKEYVEALLTLKREKPKKLHEEFGLNWIEVRTRRFHFSRKDEVVAFLEKPVEEVLSLFRNFVKQYLIPAKRFAVEITGSAALGLTADEAVEPYAAASKSLQDLDDVLAFRETLTWHESNTSILR